MSGAEIVARVRALGRSIRLDGADVVIRPPLPPGVREEIRPHKAAIVEFLRDEAAERAADIARRARLLRECSWSPCSLAECTFHIGRANEPCRRCGAHVAEHYGLPAPQAGQLDAG